MKKITALVLVITLMLGISPVVKADSVFAAESYTMTVGDTMILRPYSTSGKVITSYSWISNMPFVVEVSTNSSASCIIKANSSTGSSRAVVTFNYYYYIDLGTTSTLAQGQDAFYITVESLEPESITMTPSLSMNLETSSRLTPVMSPSNAETTYTWRSSNSSVATVTEGNVYARGVGSAVITVTTANNLSASCNVTVTAPALSLVSSVPENNAGEVSSDTDIILTYNTYISAGSTYENIVLKDSTTGEVTECDITLSGKKLTAVPEEVLRAGHTYTFAVPKGAIKNNSSRELGWDSVVTFTVKAMELLSTVPENNGKNVAVDQDITLEFDGEISKGNRWNNINIKNEDTGENIVFTASTEGSVLRLISYEDMDYSASYIVTVPQDSIKNSIGAGNTKEYVICFDTKPPVPQAVSSKPESSLSALNESIILNFNCDITEGTAFKNITMSVGENIKEVSAIINGNSIIITPVNILSPESEYILSIPKDAVINSADEGNEEINMTFSTAPRESTYVEAPVILPESGTINKIKMITITCSDEEADIYYTADGSDPLENGILYTGQFTLKGNESCVRAVVLKGNALSEETRRDYKIFNIGSPEKIIFGGESSDHFGDMEITDDGYIAVGYASEENFGTGLWSDTTGKGENDAVIVKFDKEGNVLWKYNFGGKSNDYFHGVAVIEGGYVAAGQSWDPSFRNGDWTGVSSKDGSSTMYSDAILVKFDNEGNILWKRNFGGSGADEFLGVCAADGGFTAVGNSTTFGSGDWLGSTKIGKGLYDATLVKFDSDGNMEWKRNIGSDLSSSTMINQDEFTAVHYGNNSYTAVGSYSDKYIIANYSTSGVRNWYKVINNRGQLKDVVSTENGYTAAGESYSQDLGKGDLADLSPYGGYDAVIISFDTEGNMLWADSFGGSGNDSFSGITAVSDGYVTAGYAYASSFGNGTLSDVVNKGGSDALVVKYDTEGRRSWITTFGGSGADGFNKIKGISDSLYIACGYTFPSGTEDTEGLTGYGNTDAALIQFENLPLEIIPGDIDGNGIVNRIDSALLLKYLSNILLLSAEQLEAADINGDGDIDITDCVLILNENK